MVFIYLQTIISFCHNPRIVTQTNRQTDVDSETLRMHYIRSRTVQMRGPICTKFGGDIFRSSLHTEFKNDEDILLDFQTTAVQIRALLSEKAKIALFDPL